MTVLANTLAAGAALKLPMRIVVGFTDAAVNHLLDLDTDREVALAVVPFGSTGKLTPDAAPAIESLHLPTVPLSKTKVDYPAIRAMHTASTLLANEVLSWRGAFSARPIPPPTGRLYTPKTTGAVRHNREDAEVFVTPLAVAMSSLTAFSLSANTALRIS